MCALNMIVVWMFFSNAKKNIWAAKNRNFEGDMFFINKQGKYTLKIVYSRNKRLKEYLKAEHVLTRKHPNSWAVHNLSWLLSFSVWIQALLPPIFL